MESLKLLFLLGVCLSLLDTAISDPIPQNETIYANETVYKPPDEGCGRKGGKNDFQVCIMEHFLPENVTRGMYNESRCPTCAHICSKSESILNCAYSAIDERAQCNQYVRDVGERFFRGIFAATVAFFCEGGGDRLTTIDDSQNMRCIVTQESNCTISLIPDDRSDSRTLEFTPEALCRNFISGLSCVAKKAEACNQETAALFLQYADYLKTNSPCSSPAGS
ncbi:uncharacterized protein LOC124154346 [Ischnura elegans]|uniref:uncharacterized protein LOC124154346 n=1 Tax=Ischnura elegans TaxID=197161 RepID=UPI001ED8928F|nr:uncharacterized protein LOC124154346 [Ischnura elegans]